MKTREKGGRLRSRGGNGLLHCNNPTFALEFKILECKI
jgi:hypothetical protein